MTLFALLALAPRPIADLPFERVGNRIYLHGTLNGKRVNVVLDSGAATSVADDALGFSAGAKKLQEIVAGGAGAKTVKAFVVSDLAVRLDGSGIESSIRVVLPLAPMTKMEGRPLETILGTDFLLRYRVEIDYAAGRLRVFDSKDEFVPEGATVLPLTLTNGLPHVAGKVELPGLGTRDATLMLDTGASAAALVSGRMVERLGLAERFRNFPEIVTGGGVGGETRGRRIRFVSLELGGAKLERPVGNLESTLGGATGRGASYDVLVGGEALRRFTLTLDYAHRRVMLVPNRDRAEPFVGDRTGLGFQMGERGGFVVKQVVPASPAAEAGILAGDALVSFGGRMPASLEEIRRALREGSGDLPLRLRRGGEEKEFVVKTRETIP